MPFAPDCSVLRVRIQEGKLKKRGKRERGGSPDEVEGRDAEERPSTSGCWSAVKCGQVRKWWITGENLTDETVDNSVDNFRGFPLALCVGAMWEICGREAYRWLLPEGC